MVPLGSTKDINGYLFTGWGAHARNYRCSYLTAAAAIGMSKADVDTFLKRLDKCLSKFIVAPIQGVLNRTTENKRIMER